MTRTLGVGIVGFGWMGKTHAHAYRSLPYLYKNLPFEPQLVGVCVRRQESIAEAVGTGGFTLGTTSLDELLARPDIHVINICTPNPVHCQQVIAALRAGKHVYCDKPLAVTRGECDRILEALAQSKSALTTQVACQYRFYPATMRAKQLIDEGRLGRLLSFRAAYLHASLVDAAKPISWRQLPGAGGGVLLDLGSHLLDLLTHLVGPMRRVLAHCHTHTTHRPDPRTGAMTAVAAEDLAAMLLETAGAAVGTAELSKLATGVNDELRIELHGDRGALRFNLAHPNALDFFDHTTPDQPIGGFRGFTRIQTIGNYPPPAGNMVPGKLNIGWLSPHAACLYNFLGAVCGCQTAHPTFAQAAALHQLLDTAERSARLNQWVNVC
jgi:predicted dehydrogenase